MEKKNYYEAPEMEKIVLINKSAILVDSGKYGKEKEAGPLTTTPYGEF